MIIDVAAKRKGVKGGGRYNGGGISDLDGIGVGKLTLTADDADDRKFITSIYRCIAPVRPLTREQNAVDRAAGKTSAWMAAALREERTDRADKGDSIVAVAKQHYSDSMMVTAWTCSDCNEDTYDGDERYNNPPNFCSRCGAEFTVADRGGLNHGTTPNTDPKVSDIRTERH